MLIEVHIPSIEFQIWLWCLVWVCGVMAQKHLVPLVLTSFFCCNTACGMDIWIYMKVYILFFINVLHGWFQVSYIFSLVKCDMFVAVIWYQYIGSVLPLMLWMPFTMFMLGSFHFVDSWSLMEHAVCPVIEWPLILMGMTLLCLGGIINVDLTIPIVTFCSQFWVYVRNLLSFCM